MSFQQGKLIYRLYQCKKCGFETDDFGEAAAHRHDLGHTFNIKDWHEGKWVESE